MYVFIRQLLSLLMLGHSEAQEVVSLLREKLHTCGSDLVEARNRVTELEVLHISEKQTFSASVDTLAQCGA
jgi:hypothetical protein